MSRQAKRQSFAAKAKHLRKVASITKRHKHTPGFAGVARGMTFTTKDGKTVRLGYGAIIMSNT